LKIKSKKVFTFITLIFLVVSSFVGGYYVYATNGSTVAIITSGSLITLERKAFRGNNYFWVFYPSGVSSLKYKSSSDGLTWSSAIEILSGLSNGWSGFDVYYAGGASIKLVAYNGSLMKYVSGTLGSGTISFGTFYSVSASYPTSGMDAPTVTIDTNGYPWVGYENNSGSTGYTTIVKATATDGSTWGVPFSIASAPFSYQCASLTALLRQSGGKVYAIYRKYSSATIFGRLYNGSDWETEQTVATSTVGDYYGYNAVVLNDWSIHLERWVGSTYNDILYQSYDPSTKTWSSSTTLASTGDNYAGGITINATSQDLYAWYRRSDVIYYRKKVGVSWQSETQAWTVGSLDTTPLFTSYANTSGSYVGAIWMESYGGDYAVKHGDLGVVYSQQYQRSADQKLNIVQTIARLSNVFRITSQSFNLLQQVSRVSTFLKSFLQSININDVVQKVFQPLRSISQPLKILSSTSRIVAIIRSIIQRSVLGNIATPMGGKSFTLYPKINVFASTLRTVIHFPFSLSDSVKIYANILRTLLFTPSDIVRVIDKAAYNLIVAPVVPGGGGYVTTPSREAQIPAVVEEVPSILGRTPFEVINRTSIMIFGILSLVIVYGVYDSIKFHRFRKLTIFPKKKKKRVNKKKKVGESFFG